MADILLQESASYLTQESGEPILLESSLPVQVENYKFASAGDGMSVTEIVR
jgi:hypothetical protein